MAKCPALLAMRGWVEYPGAPQLMLSVGSQLRVEKLRDEAVRQFAAVAERHGLSVDEFTGRTVATAAFDRTGTLGLSYGDRVFSAVLLPDDARDRSCRAPRSRCSAR
jgi:class 3 adenylate cyclase